MTRRFWIGCLLLVGAFVATPAEAHPRAMSLSSWEFRDGVDGIEAGVTVRVPWSALQRGLPELSDLVPQGLGYRIDGAAAVDAYLLEHVRLRAGKAACVRRGAVLPVASPDPAHFARRFRLSCGPGDPEITVDLFHEFDSSHLHLARARFTGLPEGERRAELDRVIVVGRASWRLNAIEAGGAESPSASSWIDYLRLGVGHIATGYDHLVFVFGLLLAGTSVAQLATVVTGFTVAHSVTLALGVLGWVRPMPEAVEALIGFSIVVVACENFAITLGDGVRRAIRTSLIGLVLAAGGGAALGAVGLPVAAILGIGLFSICYLGLAERTRRPETLRWVVAFAFGLVHGFGFAGVLVDTGLPAANVGPALLGFNLGVELGQLAVVAVGWLALRSWLRGPRRRAAIQWGSAPVLAAGLYWFLSRALAG